jgi:hypothetical protein
MGALSGGFVDADAVVVGLVVAAVVVAALVFTVLRARGRG